MTLTLAKILAKKENQEVFYISNTENPKTDQNTLSVIF